MKIVVSIIVVIFSITLWAKFYVILDNVTKGEAYGFKVGDSKSVTFQKAKLLLKNEDIHTWPLDAGACEQPSKSWLSKINFSKDCELHLIKNDIWWFHFGDDRLNNIRITFNNGEVQKIYRHRHFIEAM
jgi:hypothetical protein